MSVSGVCSLCWWLSCQLAVSVFVVAAAVTVGVGVGVSLPLFSAGGCD